MSENQRFTRYGEKKRGTQNKFYEVEALETEDGRAQWIFRWGRIGAAGQSKEGTVFSFSVAKQICLAQWEKKGYTEVTAMQALASAVETLEERKTNGLSKVEIEIPNFHAGPSEKRCRQFCEKYLAKLNLIRGSRWDLGTTAYSNQIKALLKQYCAEYKRIKGSKTHGDNLEVFADTAARIFFGALKDDAGICIYDHFSLVGNTY